VRSSSALQAVKKDAAALVKRISRGTLTCMSTPHDPASYDRPPDGRHVDLVEDVDISFARSGGAGGQNVNKVNTKADIRLNVDKIGWLDDDMKEALRKSVCGRHTRT